MARGGYGGGSGIPLRDRVAQSSATAPVSEVAVTGPLSLVEPEAGPCVARHCWISLPVDESRPRPGLLLEWRRVDLGRWEGRVIYPAQLRPGRWASVEEWVPAELLTAADQP